MPSRLVTPSIQPFGNPHYWLDPEDGRKIAQALGNKLSEVRPHDASYFDDRFQTFRKRLADAEEKWTAEMRPYDGRKVVTFRAYVTERLQVLLTKQDVNLSREAEEAIRFVYERSQEIRSLIKESSLPRTSA